MKRPRYVRCGAAIAASLSIVGCFSPDNGPPPPPQQLYYPTGLAVSPMGHVLYVVNSDLDLQYTGGTVQTLNLDAIRALTVKLWSPAWPAPGEHGPNRAAPRCSIIGLSDDPPSAVQLYPGPCTAIDLLSPGSGFGPLLTNSRTIGAFGTDLALTTEQPLQGATGACGTQTPAGHGARLLVPVPGDPSLTWIDIVDDRFDPPTAYAKLECGQDSSDRCDDFHKAGTDPSDNTRSETMPGQPFEIAVAEGGGAIAVTHQTTGAVSLFLNGWGQPPLGGAACAEAVARPTLAYVLGGLASNAASGIEAMPVPQIVKSSQCYSAAHAAGATNPFGSLVDTPAFLLSYRDSANLTMVSYYDDCNASPDRPFLSLGATTPVAAAAGGYDSREVAIDAHARQACEAGCGTSPSAAQCLLGCAGLPADIYLANRTPPALLLGQTVTNVGPTGSAEQVAIYDQVPLEQGASRVVLGNVLGLDGAPHQRVFVICFDARFIYVYDPEKRVIESVIHTGRGPQALALDPWLQAPSRAVAHDDRPGNFAYVAHFTDSYVGVIDLDQRHADTYLTLVATVGVPIAPRDSD